MVVSLTKGYRFQFSGEKKVFGIQICGSRDKTRILNFNLMGHPVHGRRTEQFKVLKFLMK